jgi:hypothetical protein
MQKHANNIFLISFFYMCRIPYVLMSECRVVYLYHCALVINIFWCLQSAPRPLFGSGGIGRPISQTERFSTQRNIIFVKSE